MNNLTQEKTMTVKEVSIALGVSRDLIEKRIRELFPDKMSQGKTTHLNEKEVTLIKMRIQENSSLATSDDRNKLSNMPKTDKEMTLQLVESAKYFKDKYDIVKKENELLENKISNDKPKICIYNAFIDSDNLYSMSNAAKALDTGRTRLFMKLRDSNVLMRNNEPYQRFCDSGYFIVKYKTINTGDTVPVTKVTPKGLVYIRKVFGDNNV